jgi:hypothetical protein
MGRHTVGEEEKVSTLTTKNQNHSPSLFDVIAGTRMKLVLSIMEENPWIPTANIAMMVNQSVNQVKETLRSLFRKIGRCSLAATASPSSYTHGIIYPQDFRRVVQEIILYH